jgi:hypothetical protein
MQHGGLVAAQFAIPGYERASARYAAHLFPRISIELLLLYGGETPAIVIATKYPDGTIDATKALSRYTRKYSVRLTHGTLQIIWQSFE